MIEDIEVEAMIQFKIVVIEFKSGSSVTFQIRLWL